MSTASITPDTLDHVARLARLRLTDQEKQKFAEQLSTVFSYLKILDSVAIPEGLTTNFEMGNNNFRPDTVVTSFPQELMLSTASTDGKYVIAPKTVHKE